MVPEDLRAAPQPAPTRRDMILRVAALGVATTSFAAPVWAQTALPAPGAAAAPAPLKPGPLKHMRDLRGHQRSVLVCAISPDGATALSAGYDKTLRVWDLESGREKRRFNLIWRSVNALDFAADGRAALASGDIGDLQYFKIEDGSVIRDLISQRIRIRAARLLPRGDGQPPLAVSANDRGRLAIWDLKTGKIARAMSSGAGGLRSLALSADGARIATGDVRGRLALWDAAGGSPLKTAQVHRRMIWAVALSADARIAYSASASGEVAAWSFADGRKLWSARAHGRNASALALSPNGEILISGGDDGSIIAWRAADGRQLQTAHRAHRGRVNALCVSADGRRTLSAGADKNIKLWSLSQDQAAD